MQYQILDETPAQSVLDYPSSVKSGPYQIVRKQYNGTLRKVAEATGLHVAKEIVEQLEYGSLTFDRKQREAAKVRAASTKKARTRG